MFELGKTYRDGLGRNVRIIATDAKRTLTPIIGLVETEGGAELIEAYREDGTIYPLSDTKKSLVLPRRYVSMDDALSLIRRRLQGNHVSMNLIDADLKTMPFKELTDA